MNPELDPNQTLLQAELLQLTQGERESSRARAFQLLEKCGDIGALNYGAEPLLFDLFRFTFFELNQELIGRLIEHGLSLKATVALEHVFGAFVLPIPQAMAARVTYFPGAMQWIYWLIENKYWEANEQDQFGATVLHWLIAAVDGPHGKVAHFERLIELGCDLDLRATIPNDQLAPMTVQGQLRPDWEGQTARELLTERGLSTGSLKL